jgi:hypothetical protein
VAERVRAIQIDERRPPTKRVEPIFGAADKDAAMERVSTNLYFLCVRERVVDPVRPRQCRQPVDAVVAKREHARGWIA